MRLDEIKVTEYRNVFDTEGHTTDFATFIDRPTTEENDRLCAMVDELRASTDKFKRDEIKKALPQVCIGGIVRAPRKAEHIEQLSGFVCIDIDRGHGNAKLTDDQFRSIGKLLMANKNVLYLAHSVGGVGWYALMPLKYYNRYTEHFRALQRIFAKCNVEIDEGYKSIAQMRCWSPTYLCDELPNGFYYNPDAIPFAVLDTLPPPPPIKHYSGTDDTRAKVETIVRNAEERNANLCETYDEWYKLGASLTELGEDGKEFFQRLSKIDTDKYSDREFDKKWRSVQGVKGISIGTFFEIAKRNNLM